MTGVGITLPDGESATSDPLELPVFLDSGGTLSRLPTPIYQSICESFPGALLDESSGFYIVDCSVGDQPGSVDFIFNTKTIRVPYADFIWEAEPGLCVVGVLPEDGEYQMLLLLAARNLANITTRTLQKNQCLEPVFSAPPTWFMTKTTETCTSRKLPTVVQTSKLLALVPTLYPRPLATVLRTPKSQPRRHLTQPPLGRRPR
jgi:hypothetical protein